VRSRSNGLGFEAIDLADWSEPVLGGFRRHVRARWRELVRPRAASLAVLATAAAASAGRRGWITDVRTLARKPAT